MNALPGFRRLARLLTLLTLLVSLAACTPEVHPEPKAYIDAYFTALKVQDFGGCYALLTTKDREEMTLSDFINKHTNVYQALSLRSIAVVSETPKREGSAAWLYPCTILYDSTTLGQIQQRFILRLSATEDGWAVDWDISYIFEHMKPGDTVRLSTLTPKRGEILSSDSVPYAINMYADTIFAHVEKIVDQAGFARLAAPLLDMSDAELIAMLNTERARRDGIAILKFYLPGELSEEKKAALLAIPGTDFDDKVFSPIRYYPQGGSTAHLIGYMGFPTEEELKNLDSKEYDDSTRIGKTGLEAAHEALLHGKSGLELSLLDEKGAKKEVLATVPVQNGLDLELTLDSDLQARAAEAFSQLPADERGSAIVIDYTTGDLLAATTWSTFDPNLFTFPVSISQLAEWNDPVNGQPLLNRYTRGLYAPGSTVKPLVACLALETGQYTMGTEFKGKVEKKKWTPTGEPWPYPPITRVADYAAKPNMENAIINSDNIYFASVALKLGWDNLQKFLVRVGMDEAIPFDLPVLRARIFANQENYSNRRLLANTGYGQGELLITPLQLAYVWSSLVNNGDIMKPRVVKATRSMIGLDYVTEEAFPPSVWKSGVLKTPSLNAVAPAIRKVMTEGSGRKSQVPGIKLSGKTGTAEVTYAYGKREITYIVAATDPSMGYTRLVLVLVEVKATVSGEDTSESRHIIARKLLEP